MRLLSWKIFLRSRLVAAAELDAVEALGVAAGVVVDLDASLPPPSACA